MLDNLRMENSSNANLQRRREYIIEKCKSQINWLINKIVLIEAFDHGDVIFVAAVTKMVFYKTHLFAIQYTKIAHDSNFYDQLCAKFNNFGQIEENFFKTELVKLFSDTFIREFDALKKFNDLQIHTPNAEEIFNNNYIHMRNKESDTGIIETLSRLNESNPRNFTIKSDKVYPPYIIKRGNQSRWTESELQHEFLNLCRANRIDAFKNDVHQIPNTLSLNIPIHNKTLEISHQKYISVHIWEADFFVIIKEHLYSEGYHLEEKTRTVTKTETNSNGTTREYEEEVTDIYKHEEVNFDHIFIGSVYLAENTSSAVYEATNQNTLKESVQSLFRFFSRREFNSLFRRDCSLLIKYVPHNTLRGKNLDQILPIGSIVCPKMGRFYHPGAIYLGKGQVGHAPLWRDEHFIFKIQDLIEYMGPINELMEVRWLFRPYSNIEIITKSREMERGQNNLLRDRDYNPDSLVYRCAMDISECSNLNVEYHDLFELIRAKNFTEVFRRNQEILAEIIRHRVHKYNELTLDSMFHFGSVLCASRNILYGHAAVYLGNGTVAHVTLDIREVGTDTYIFKIEPFSSFLKDSTEVKEYRWRYSPFSPEQIWSKIIEMTEQTHKYSLHSQNCEHLAFQCAMDINLSPQLENPVKRIGARAVGGFLFSGSASKSFSYQ